MIRMCEPERCVDGKCDIFKTCTDRVKYGAPQPKATPLQLAERQIKVQAALIEQLRAQGETRKEAPIVVTPTKKAKK